MATDTLTIQPSAKDTDIYEAAPTGNNGTNALLVTRGQGTTSRQRILAEFSKAGLDSTAIIVSATLSLYLNAVTPGRTVLVHKLKHTDWVEEQATWNIYKTGSNWTDAGGDYEASAPTPASAVMPGAADAWVDWDVTDIVTAAWAAVEDFEFLIRDSDETGATANENKFYSKEWGTAGQRPKLVITYVIPPTAPTGLIATEGLSTDKVSLVWTAAAAGTNAVGGYKVYRDDVDISGWLGDVLTYDDEGADPPVITPGAAAASQERYFSFVKVEVTGESIADGTTHSYKVRAKDTDGYEGPDSASDTGYRGTAELAYQWQRSAADSDAAYSDISGAVTDIFKDYAAPASPAARYYKCKITATDAADAYTTPARGYRRSPSLPAITPKAQLIIKNPAGETLSYVPEAWGIHTDYRVNEIPSLSFSCPVLPYYDIPYLLMEDGGQLLRENGGGIILNDYVPLGSFSALANFADPNEAWLYKDGVLQDIFYITAPEKVGGSRNILNVECLGIGYTLRKSSFVTYSATATATVHLTALLAKQESAVITLGGVDPALDISFLLELSNTDVWEACKAVRDTAGGFLYFDFDPAAPSTRRLWLWGAMGEAKGQQIRINKNLLGISHRTDYIAMFNKLLPFGDSSLSLTSKTYTEVDVTKSADAVYGYLTLKEQYAAYKDWTAAGAALPANVTIKKAGGGWVSPTGGSGWTNSANAYDGNPATQALYVNAFTGIPVGAYSAYLEVTIASTTTTSVRIYNSTTAVPGEVDIYYSGGWHNIRSLAYLPAGWNTFSFDEQDITAVRIRFYNNYSSPIIGIITEVEIWSASGYTDVTSDWEQGANENIARCAIGDYDADAPYIISYTHAAYLIALDDITSRAVIYSTTKEFSTADVDTLRAQGCVYLTDIKTAPLTLDIDYLDLSVEEGREFEELQLGSTVVVIDEDLGVSESAVVMRIEKPDMGNHPEQATLEIGSLVKTLNDIL